MRAILSMRTRLGWNSALNIRLTPTAVDDLKAIRAYIAQFNATAAERILARIQQSILLLEEFPNAGREGAVTGTREFSIPNLAYIVVYRIASATDLDVLSVLHERRQYP